MFFCTDNNFFLLRISLSIVLNKVWTLSFFKIIAALVVSGRPPLLLIITADPLLAASKLVLPKGSFHLEQTTEILIFFKLFSM